MSLLSCLMYMLANVVLMVILWLYNRARQRQQLVRREQTAVSLDDAFTGRLSTGSSRQVANTSLLAVLGLQESRTFFSFEDHFSSYAEVADACRRAGLEKAQLILGVDFSASNEWQGRKTFNSHCLHRVVPGKVLNPYQKVISIIGRTLESFDQDNFIPTFGFADKQTNGHGVFPFTMDPRGCQGFAEVLERYDRVATQVNLGGPTSFAPIIHEAISIVQQKNVYHILIIIADGQVNEYKPTVDAIVEASSVPLSIVVVGVGDGPWDAMEQFDDCLPERHFDNFQFVNFHKVTAKRKNPDASLALHVMMEIPDQYKTIKALGYLDPDPATASAALAGWEKAKRKSTVANPQRFAGPPSSKYHPQSQSMSTSYNGQVWPNSAGTGTDSNNPSSFTVQRKSVRKPPTSVSFSSNAASPAAASSKPAA